MATLKVIGSSSSGNAYILDCKDEQLIIELGVSFREILEGLNYKLDSVVGALCSHC